MMSTMAISVLLCLHTDARGGAEEHALELLNGLDRQLFRPHLACTPQLAELLQRDLAADVEVFPLTLDSITHFAGARKLARILRTRKIQILHSHQFRASLFASPIGRLCGVPVIVETSHGREVWRKGLLRSRFFVDHLVAQCVDRFIAVSEATARHLIEKKGIPEHKISVIRSAIDLRKFDPNWPAPSGMKRSMGFAEGDPVLVVLGRLEPQKGHRVLIEAMPQVIQEFPTARLVCLSDGSLRAELEELVAERDLIRNVRFVGRQPDVRDWLALAEFTVLPSFYEGLPLAAIESLAAGRPIVATAVDGTPEVVLDGETGLTVPPGDPEALAKAIRRMLREPEWARASARIGREFVLQNFSIDKLLEATEELYLQAWQAKTGFAHHPHEVPRSSPTTEVRGTSPNAGDTQYRRGWKTIVEEREKA